MDQVLAFAVQEASKRACEGTALLLAQRPKDATSNFNRALDILRIAVDGAYRAQQRQGTTADDRPANAPVHEFIQVKVPGLDDERFFVFDYAMVYAEDKDAQTDHTSAVVRCAATLFNLALSFHQLGKTSNEQDSLRSAIDLYRTCARLLLVTDSSLECSALTCLAMAALNNEACLHFDMGCSAEFYLIQEDITRTTQGMAHNWSPEQQRVIREFLVNFAVTENCAPAARTA